MGRFLIAEQWLFELTASILCISSVAEVSESEENAVFPTLKSLVNTVPTEIVNSNDIPASEIIITSDTSNSDDTSEPNNDTKSSLSVKGGQGLIQELFTPELSLQESNIIQNHVIEISETGGPGKSNIDEASQHLAQLCDKAFDAEDGANRANQEEILCWAIYGKDFRVQFNDIIKNSGGKIGEKKARSLLYDSITKQLSIIRKKRSQKLDNARHQNSETAVKSLPEEEIRSNVLRRVSDGSENSLVETIAHLIEVSLYQLPIEHDVEVIRGERQSIASKNQKVLEEISSRGDRPDLMIRASLKRKQNEIVYVESGKWVSTDQKIRDDHNKLAKLCSHGYNEIVKGKLRKVYIAFGINIAGSKFILSGLIQEESIKYYMPIIEAKIPFHDESVEK
ncbi:4312_t:CDS:2 [Entrophospora sp. SA101]|nr:4312_t:CDS:2 [Entrophospora sp. SA101]